MNEDLSNNDFVIRPATAADEVAWREMWADYCQFYGVVVPEAATQATWERIVHGDSAIHGLIVIGGSGRALGFANYVLHPHTWSAKTLCYMEDLYVRPEARGQRIAQHLIDHLITLGRIHDWGRVYWHTNQANEIARRVYDRFAPADPYVRYTVSL